MRRWIFLFLLFPICTQVAVLRATQFDPLSIEQLSEQATVVVKGTVLTKSCQRDPRGRIYTKVELQVAEVWKGSPTTNRFTIVHGGGILGSEKATVSGQVDYDIGEEVVAFFVLNQRGEGVTLGLAQGKFSVWKDAKTGEKLARNLFHGEQASSEENISKNRLATQPRLTLAELKRRVQGGVQ